jgi:hypothetical protein
VAYECDQERLFRQQCRAERYEHGRAEENVRFAQLSATGRLVLPVTYCHNCKHCVRIMIDNSKHKSAEECAPLGCNELLTPISKIGNGDGTLPFGAACPLFDKE